ncbi:MAG: hypothetical protein QOH64_3226 [Acidimicrobiaceae bacterium]
MGARGGRGAGIGETERMGLNPFRQHRRSPADYVLVAAAIAVVLVMVLWAFLG